jgi:hypothetical protein
MTYRFYHVLSETDYLAHVPDRLKTEIGGVDPCWLISALAVNEIRQCPTGIDFLASFKFTRKDCLRLCALDNGAFSFGNGAADLDEMTPAMLREIANDNCFGLVFSPDWPMWIRGDSDKVTLRQSLNDGMLAQKCREDDFYRELTEKKKGQIILDTIHGPIYRNDEYSLHYRKKWCKQTTGGRHEFSDGVALGDLGGTARELAYFTLHAWAIGSKYCHVFARADSKAMIVLSYLAQVTGMTVSSDAKSYTIDDGNNMSLLIDRPDRNPKEISLRRGNKKKPFYRENIENECACSCPVCRLFQGITKSSIVDLAVANNANDSSVTHVLREWIVTHNVYVIEKFIERLCNKCGTRKLIIKFGQACGFDDIAEVLKLVDDIVSGGTEHYEKNICLL